ncbi:MAG: GNAT family N-acetyltransferase [bacterium]|nr:GNAT family N-acetyltransferase [bacterium]
MPEKIEQIKTNSEPKKPEISLKPEDMTGKFDVDEIKKKEAIQERAKITLIESLSRGYINYREENLEGVDHIRSDEDEDGRYNDNYSDDDSQDPWTDIPASVKFSPEVYEAATQGMFMCFSNGDVDRGLKIKNVFTMPYVAILSPEGISSIKKALEYSLSHDNTDDVLKIVTAFLVPNNIKIPILKDTQEALGRNVVTTLLSNGYVDSAIEVKEKLCLSAQIVSSPEVQRAVREKMLDILSEDYIELVRVIKLSDAFSFPFEDLVKVGKEGMVSQLSGISSRNRRTSYRNDYRNALRIKEELKLPDEVLLSPEVQDAARDTVARLLSDGSAEDAKNVLDKFSLSASALASPEIQQAAKISIIRCLNSDAYDVVKDALNIKSTFAVSDETFTSPEIQGAAKKIVVTILSKGNYSYIESAVEAVLEIKKKFLLSAEEVQNAAKEGVRYRLSDGDVRRAVEIRDKFAVPVDFVSTPEIQNAAKVGMIKCLSKGEADKAVKIKDQFSIPSEFFLSPEIQKAAKGAIVNQVSSAYIDDNYFKRIEEIRDKFSVSTEFISSPETQQAAKDRVIKCLQGEGDRFTRRLHDAIRIKDEIPLSAEVVSSPEIQNAAKIFIVNELSKGNINESRKTQGRFAVLPELMLQAAKEGMMALLRNGNIYEASNVKGEFSITTESISSPDVQEATKKGVAKCLADGEVERALEMQEKFLLPIEVMMQTAKEEMIKDLLFGTNKIDIAVKIKNGFHFSAEIISSVEVQEAAKKGMLAWVLNGYVDREYFSRIAAIREEFSLPTDFISSPEVQSAAKAGIVKCLSIENIDYALKIRDVFSLSNDDTEKAATEGMLARLTSSKRGDKLIDDAIKIKDSFSLSAEACRKVAKEAMSQKLESGGIEYAIKIQEQFALSAGDISEASKKAFLKCLAENKTETAEKIREKFKVSVNSEDIFEVIPEIRTLLASLRDISPEFATQAEKTPDLLLSLLEFRNNPDSILNVAKENPFLLDAIANNPRFGSRLLVKYRQFDVAAKENIKTQFAFKKKIMAEHPEIDPQSVEFRMLMQDALKEYGKNKEVVEEIDERGINSDRWLNYDETAYFNLGSNENTLAFSEVITTPIARIKETIDTYAYTIKDVLKEYREELLKFEIKLGASEAPTEELQKMMTALEKARLLPANWKDKNGKTRDKVIFGIEKGIENLKSKSSQERKGVLWEKLLADVASFQRLKDDVFKSQEIFVATEKELGDALSEKIPSGKKIQDIKRKIATAKEDLRSKFMVMERRIEDFRKNLEYMIAPALGTIRAVALIQEINTKLAEQFNHFDADRSMLKNLFSPQSNKTKEEMESRPMSIFVWTRNPDIDLYQGNYSLCCVRIDSEYHGAESPIADYNTDLGIQIVNIWDETKNEPITAAWCWLGEDEDGKPALIVDNIECNTLFSANFSEQLTKELFKYLEGYAKAIGVKKIVLGKANNDMPTAGELSKMADNDGKYSKIGGANRSDGYFLEAEDVNVKIVWEKGRKAKVKKEIKEKLNAERIVFNEVNTQALLEDDFSSMRDLERRIYANDVELIQGQELVQDIKDGNGLEYSVAIWGVAPGSTKKEMIAYAVAVEDETDEGDKSVYLEDIAVVPEAQRQGIGWKLIQAMIGRLQEKASSESKPVLFDMHLRPNSLSMFDAHREEFVEMGITQIEDVLVPDYYGDGDDAVYRVYEVSPSRV